MQAFTDKIALGNVAFGHYAVTLNLVQAAGNIAQAAGTLDVTANIVFDPAQPTASDIVVAYLNIPGCGGSSAVVNGFQITATTVPGQVCFTGPPIAVTLGPLPPGTYHMTWFLPAQTQVASAALVVTQGGVVASTPALGPYALLGLMLGLGLLAACSLRRRRHV
jgi:hypothetical protein